MKVRVIFYARWLSGDNLVHITFHEDDPYWISEIPLWQAQIPKDGHWHRMQADLHVPPFLHGETALRLCVGVTNLRWPADADVKNTEYLLDDISMTVLEAGKPAIPAPPNCAVIRKRRPARRALALRCLLDGMEDLLPHTHLRATPVRQDP